MTHHATSNLPIHNHTDNEKDETATAPDVNSHSSVYSETKYSVQSTIEVLTDSTIDDSTPSSSDQEQLIQNIIKSADMACKAKRLNRLLSYVSGIDYSYGLESSHDRNCSDPKSQEVKQYFLNDESL